MADLNIADFIQARLNAEEQQARSVPGPRWKRGAILFDSGNVCEEYIAVDDPNRREVVLSDVDGMVIPFVVTWDPQRVLAEVEAKRRLLARHGTTHGFWTQGDDGSYITACIGCGGDIFAYPCASIRDLASLWPDHAEYRAEWALQI